MTSYEKPDARPGGEDAARFLGFDYLQYYCSNARTAASFYITRLGFEPYAYSGLETGSREVATHVLRQGSILLAFSNSITPAAQDGPMAKEVSRCGDFVRDVAFKVDDCKAMYEKAVARGAVSVLAPTELTDDSGQGSVWKATIKTYGNVVHSFIQRDGYSGEFLPGFKLVEKKDPLVALLPPSGAQFIDHVVGNVPDQEMIKVCE
jgi:4-hydroxyphenylpyruvate dioxygenase